MAKTPESATSNFLDAQVRGAVLSDSLTQSSLDQLLIPTELPSTRPLPPASDRLKIEDDGSKRDGHGNVATPFGLGSPENPILIDKDDEEGHSESEPQSMQYVILSEDRDDMPRHDNTVLESDGVPSARSVRALLSGSSTCTLQ